MLPGKDTHFLLCKEVCYNKVQHVLPGCFLASIHEHAMY